MRNLTFVQSLSRLTWDRILLCLLATCLLCQAGHAQETSDSNKSPNKQSAADNQHGPSSTARGKGKVKYAPFFEPTVVKSEGGVINVTLNLAVRPNTVAGRVIQTATYNATVPGPTLLARPGDLLRIQLINNLALPGQKPPPQKIVPCGEPSSSMAAHASMASGSGPDPSMFL